MAPIPPQPESGTAPGNLPADIVDSVPDPWMLARAMAQQAVMDGNGESALQVLQEAMNEQAAAGRWVLAVALAEAAGAAALRAAQWQEAEAICAQGHAWARTSGDVRARGSACIAEACLAYHLGDESRALQSVGEAWRDIEQTGDPLHRIDCMTLFGAVLSDMDQEELALPWHQQALEESERLAESGVPGTHRRLARAHSNVSARLVTRGLTLHEAGLVAEGRDYLLRCIEHARKAFELNRQIDLRSSMAIAKSNWALALAYLGDHAGAMAALDEADDLRGNDRGNHAWINGRYNRVQAWLMHGDLARAQQVLDHALADAQAGQVLDMITKGLYLASQVAERSGDLARALALYKEFHESQKKVVTVGAEASARLLAVRMQTEVARTEATRLRQVSMEDPLTGLANRRALDEALAALHLRARESGRPLCLAMLDIDHFKRVNDEHSHPIGDAVLRRVGALMRSVCRGHDVAARYGGEEFVLVLEDTDLSGAAAVCERLRRAVEHENWSTLSPGLAVTTSIGVLDIARHGDLSDGLAAADRALYRAKHEGRNRSVAEA